MVLTRSEPLIANRIGYITVFTRDSAIEVVGAFDPMRVYELGIWIRLASRYDFFHLDRSAAVASPRPLVIRWREATQFLAATSSVGVRPKV